MAVKQNNTETNATPSSASNGSTVNVGNSNQTVSNGVTTGTKSKILNVKSQNNDNTEQPGCSGDANATKQKILLNTLSDSDFGGISIPKNGRDLDYILKLIDRIDAHQQTYISGHDFLKIYKQLIYELSLVQMPRNSPEELKYFKDNISKVGAFFAKSNEKGIYFIYLRIVCQLITQMDDNVSPPSCAIAIIFQLFSAEMVIEAVQLLLDHKMPDQNIRRTMRLLSEWLCICNFCQNLNLWIITILKGLRAEGHYALYDEIALDNIDQLFGALIVPVLRPKVSPIVFSMLTTTYNPQVFHKILPKFQRLIAYLKKQLTPQENGDNIEETTSFLEKLVEVTYAVIERFYGYSDLYEPIEQIIRRYFPSFTYVQRPIRNYDDDVLLTANAHSHAGLVNLGNTCYMNSVLQALALTKVFSREILLSECKSPVLIKMKEQIALMLYSFRYEITPIRLLNVMRPPGFLPGIQQDSSEFLGYVLETLHEQEYEYCHKTGNKCSSSTEIKNKTINNEDIADDGGGGGADVGVGDHINNRNNQNIKNEAAALSQSENIDDNDGQKDIRKLSTPPAIGNINSQKDAKNTILTAIDKTFTGEMASLYKCLVCGWESRNTDTFRDLQLAFPEVENDCVSNYSVQDLIDYYCSTEKLDGNNQYYCEVCKKLTDAERNIYVIRSPKNLILTLKHFKYDQKYNMRAKLMHKVFHDEKVSLKICAENSLNETALIHYDLYAAVVHAGYSMDSGHYYTYGSDSRNKWFKFNDSVVMPAGSKDLHGLSPPNTPYILFYEMTARSNESPETLETSSSKVIKVDIPEPPKLQELPSELRDYINHDNGAYNEELKMRHRRLISRNALQSSFNPHGNGDNGNGRGGGGNSGGGGYDDDDDDQLPPSSGCGNDMDFNVNRFVY